MFNEFTSRGGAGPLIPASVQKRRKRVAAPKKKPGRGTNRPFSASANAPKQPPGPAYGMPDYVPPSAPARKPPSRRKK